MQILFVILENLWLFMTVYLITQNWTTIKRISITRKILSILVILIGAPIFMIEKVLEYILDLILEGER